MGAPKLTPRQHKAVEALLLTGEVSQAAQAARVSRDTLYRWLRSPEFQAAVNEAEGRALQTLAGRLVGLAEQAAVTLQDVMSDPKAPPGARVMAAGKVLDALLKLRELVTLEERITRMEAMQHVQIVDSVIQAAVEHNREFNA